MNFKYRRMDIIKQRFFYKRAFLIYALFLATELFRFKAFDFVTIFMMLWGIGLLAYDVYDSKGKCLFKNVVLLSYMILGLYTFIEGKIILALIFFGTWYIMFKAPFSTDEFIRKNNNK